MVLHQNTEHIHIQLLASPMTCTGWIGHENLKGYDIDIADQVIVSMGQRLHNKILPCKGRVKSKTENIS